MICVFVSFSIFVVFFSQFKEIFTFILSIIFIKLRSFFSERSPNPTSIRSYDPYPALRMRCEQWTLCADMMGVGLQPQGSNAAFSLSRPRLSSRPVFPEHAHFSTTPLFLNSRTTWYPSDIQCNLLACRGMYNAGNSMLLLLQVLFLNKCPMSVCVLLPRCVGVGR